MADNQNLSPEEQEKAFWDKMTGVLNSWADSRAKTSDDGRAPKGDPPKDPPTGTSRTGGERVTLTGLIADIVFGPRKD